VESHVPAAIAVEYFHTALGKELGRGKNVRRLSVSAQSDHRRMFEQKKYVADTPILAQLNKTLLQTKASGVINRAELEDGDQEFLPRIADQTRINKNFILAIRVNLRLVFTR